ncbi:MAG: major facilitator superfamily 1 [Acidobacteria bacterium]|nr:major facilitator superfamily 1 [Acidobacteriota bacterium]
MSADERREGRTAWYALTVLTFVNLFNYLDRSVLGAILESLHIGLGLNDTQLGLATSAFMIVYMLTSPIFGSLGDRRSRPRLIAFGVAIWSVATAAGGFARGFISLLVARAFVGVGEAAYGSIAPPLLSDHFPLERRGRVFAFFFAAIPIGSAAGFILGGLVDKAFGWRAAFMIAGAPGLLLALLALTVFDPPRGQHDPPVAPKPAGEPWHVAYKHLFKNKPYLLTVLGYAAYTFGLGALVAWMPAFLIRVRHMSGEDATITFGEIAVATGFIGTFLGGRIGDYFLKFTPRAYLWISGITTILAVPATYIALTSPERRVFIPAMVVGELLLFASTGPVNSAISNAVSPTERATAFGLSVFIMHLLGDVPSAPLIGFVSDRSDLAHAVLMVPIAIAIGGIIWTFAAWHGGRGEPLATT